MVQSPRLASTYPRSLSVLHGQPIDYLDQQHHFTRVLRFKITKPNPTAGDWSHHGGEDSDISATNAALLAQHNSLPLADSSSAGLKPTSYTLEIGDILLAQ